MLEHYPAAAIDATPNDVLAILRDQHRQQCGWDPEADSDVDLTRQSTIGEWRMACDLVAWKPLANAMNAAWEIDVSLDQWHAVLEPESDHTLGEVCDLVARHAKLPGVRPLTILGRECLSASVFLTIRSFLAEAGADVHEIRPSTRLADFTRRHGGVFLGPVARLAPGSLPTVAIRTPLYEACIWVFAASLLGILVGIWTGIHFGFWTVGLLSVAVGVSAYIGIWIAARWTLPASVEFGELKTFRDLSTRIATHLCRTASAP